MHVKLIPMPMTKRPEMNMATLRAAVCTIVPQNVSSEPKKIAQRRPYASANGPATMAPANPPTKTTVVIRPIMLAFG
jgi:hypothetical protein